MKVLISVSLFLAFGLIQCAPLSDKADLIQHLSSIGDHYVLNNNALTQTYGLYKSHVVSVDDIEGDDVTTALSCNSVHINHDDIAIFKNSKKPIKFSSYDLRPDNHVKNHPSLLVHRVYLNSETEKEKYKETIKDYMLKRTASVLFDYGVNLNKVDPETHAVSVEGYIHQVDFKEEIRHLNDNVLLYIFELQVVAYGMKTKKEMKQHLNIEKGFSKDIFSADNLKNAIITQQEQKLEKQQQQQLQQLQNKKRKRQEPEVVVEKRDYITEIEKPNESLTMFVFVELQNQDMVDYLAARANEVFGKLANNLQISFVNSIPFMKLVTFSIPNKTMLGQDKISFLG
jgi:hypothetical protein